jgi:hypothetical protein
MTLIPYIAPATLRWKWNLLQVSKHTESDDQSLDQAPESSSLTERDQSYLARGHEHHLKTELIEKWGGWIVRDMDGIRPEAWKDCHQALADPDNERAKWELNEFDKQLAREWTRRELSLAVSSITLEGILDRRMKECIDKVASRDAAGNAPKSTAPSSSAPVNATKGKAVATEEQGSRRLKEWMQSEFVIGQRKRLEKEREKALERMEKEMKAASERAKSGGRLWRDQGFSNLNPQRWWKVGLESIDEQWRTGIEGGHSAMMHTTSDREELNYDLLNLGESDEGSSTFVAQVRRQFEHWHSQRENQRRERDATITGIADADSEQLDGAYQYPEPNDSPLTQRFVKLDDITPRALANLSPATVYDLSDCEDIVWDDILKSTTHSLVNVDPALVESIPENDHLLYIGSNSGEEPAFVQRNRDRWWCQQTGNSSMFYFSPQFVVWSSCCATNATIAHIFIFITTPSRLRLGLVHHKSGYADPDLSVLIQENNKELSRIPTDEIPEELQLKEFELDQPFKPGNHELELVVTNVNGYYYYGLWDILVEFFNDTPSNSSVDEDGGNLGTMVQQ